MGAFAAVAVPAPLPALTYAVPAALDELVQPGCRVRVPLGPRKLVGVVIARSDRPPEGIDSVKEILECLDVEPVLPAALLELGGFISEYYLAPIGDTLKAMLPSSLPPWGERRITLTNAGAVAPPRDDGEAVVREALLASPRLRLAELQRQLGRADLAVIVEKMRVDGRVSVEETDRRGIRYVKAVELKPGDAAEQDERVGRSAKGRAVLAHLRELGRPATLGELSKAVGCGPGVMRRLVGLGLLRQFTQPERLSLARHRLATTERPEIILRPDQQDSLDALEAALGADRYQAFLLRGMTGSGKTEVYFRLVATALEAGRGAILLVPEIALVPALARGARARFGDQLAILHSNLSTSERHQEWERIRRGEARVVLGPRSAIFAPLTHLGVVVVDEEHDSAYKQDVVPRYNGRDLALVRARANRAVAVLVSATPSMESRHNVDSGKLDALTLTRRAGGAKLPESVLVDLRAEDVVRQPGEVVLSSILKNEITRALEADDQIILLRNRRGYAPTLLCRACGENFECPECGVSHTVHRRDRILECHHCGHTLPIPDRCPQCDAEALEPIGAGTERVEERFKELYPGVAVEVLDADVSKRPGGAAAVLERFGSGATQVLIGTQMVAKGHHFPRVALAAVLHADSYLGFPDFRAVERTYALLTQLAGRAGRGERPGRVVVQTYHPEHYAIRAALDHDDVAYAREETRFRRSFLYPPFARLVQVVARHKERARAEAAI
ncbi:MAG: primosomal protein N', partial [Acidobacteriota bacterium]